MTFASTSSVVVYGAREPSFGVVATTGNHQAFRVTGESLKFDLTKEASEEINDTRTIDGEVIVNAATSGSINSEVYYGADFSALLEDVLQSSFVAFGTNGVGTAVSVDITTTTITASVAPTGNNAFTGLQKGQWFRISSAGANNGKLLRVSTTTAPTSTVITLDTNTPGTAATGESIQIQSSRLTHGTTKRYWSLERRNTDIGLFTVYRGQAPSRMSLSFSSGARSTATFDFMGKNSASNTSTYLPGTTTAASTYNIHAGVGGAVNALWLDGAPATAFFKSISLSFDNSMRAIDAMNNLGAVGVGNGTIALTADVQLYLEDASVYNKFIANTATSIIFSSIDESGNGYVFTIPKANLSDYTSNADGKDQEQMIDATLTALRDSSNATAGLRKAIFIDRVGAALTAI